MSDVFFESAPELPPRQGGLLRVHCPTLAGSGYRTIKVAADSTVVEVKHLPLSLALPSCQLSHG